MAWSERLSAATPAQRTNYEIEEEGAAIHWPDVDVDIGLSTFLGISEEALYAALGWESPTKSTEEYVALVEH